MQGIEIHTRSMSRSSHGTTEHGDRLVLGLARRHRRRARRRWRCKRLPTSRAEPCRQCHVLATVDTHLPKPRHDLLATSVHLSWPYSIGLDLTSNGAA